MSEADTYVQDLARLRAIETTLRNELKQHQADEARALEDALRQLMLANQSESHTIRERHGRAAQRARQIAVDAGRRATDVAQQIARNEKLQENTLSRLRSAERAGHLASFPETERLRREQARHVRPIARLARMAHVRYAPLRAPAAEKLRVLYVTTNPYFDLMTELEVRQVQQALQGAKYRDRIEVQLRPAATFPELIAGLNSVRPHIVHFSGQTGEVFRLDDGEALPAGGVDLASLVRALVATEQPPELLVLNACGPLTRAMPVLPAVPFVIGLSDSILHTAAIVFSQQFYAAIASGQSVGAAFRHGKAKVETVLLDDDASELPEFVVRDDVDPDARVLVRS
jgi:hypothetical protein